MKGSRFERHARLVANGYDGSKSAFVEHAQYACAEMLLPPPSKTDVQTIIEKSKLFLDVKSFMRILHLHSPLLVPDPIVLASPFDAGLVVKKLLPSFFLLFNHNVYLNTILGTLRSNDATATRTSLKKVCLRSFSLYSDYSYPITFSIVGEPS